MSKKNNVSAASSSVSSQYQKENRALAVWNRLKTNKGAVIALIVLILLILMMFYSFIFIFEK